MMPSARLSPPLRAGWHRGAVASECPRTRAPNDYLTPAPILGSAGRSSARSESRPRWLDRAASACHRSWAPGTRQNSLVPITVRLEDEDGAVLGEAGDFDRLIATGDETFTLLRFVDPYGQTIFNHLQIPAVLDDLDRLQVKVTHATERNGLARLRHLAERCRDEPHLYLRFLGD